MRINIPAFSINVVGIAVVLWFVAMLGGVGTIAWQLNAIRTDTSPQIIHHTFDQQPQRAPFQRKSV